MPEPLASPQLDLAVCVNGQALPAPAYASLIEISVEDDVEGPSMFTLRLSAHEARGSGLAWVDDELFDIGGEVEIKLGQRDVLSTVFSGDISGIELDLAAEEVPALVVRGYDRRHRLLRGTGTRTFLKMKDSDIAAQIAQEHGLTPDVKDSGAAHDYVSQHGQSDLEFLASRAAAIGFEVTVDGKALRFQPRKHREGARITLATDRDLIELSARLSARNQPSEVEVRGWDPASKEAFVGKAAAGQEASMGARGGPAAADRAFGKAVLTVIDRPVATQQEAERIAREELERRALAFVQIDGTCRGRPDLRPGLVVDVQGAGRRFSGPYYLTSTAHTYTPQRGYRTAFSGRRNAT